MNDFKIKAVVFDWGHTIMNEEEERKIPLHNRQISLMPGVKEVLPQIKLRMGIWANTRLETSSDVEEWLKRAGIGEYFNCVATSYDIGHRKPDKHFFSLALKKCGYTKEEILFVGNQLNSDIKGANDFGIQNVWLSGKEYKSRDDTMSLEEVQPTYMIKSLLELPGLIENIQSKKFEHYPSRRAI